MGVKVGRIHSQPIGGDKSAVQLFSKFFDHLSCIAKYFYCKISVNFPQACEVLRRTFVVCERIWFGDRLFVGQSAMEEGERRVYLLQVCTDCP